MAKSPFYARIKRDVLTIVASVPEGRLVTFAAIGAHLDVMPRHVAYLLATLAEHERDAVPWHRAVASDGSLTTGARRADHAGRLAREGIAIRDGVAVDLEGRLTAIGDLGSGVPAQTRPPDAPPATARSRRRKG
jgi:methylated-DNA-protein-cysteine methyltransferase-like protein